MVAVSTIVLILGLVGGGAATFFLASAINTILHTLALVGAVAATGGIFYNLDKENYLDIESPVLAAISYVFLSGFTGFFLYRVFEALITLSSSVIALISIAVIVLGFFNPALLYNILVGLGEVVGGVVADEN